MKKTWILVLLIIVLAVPTFSQMLRFGIFSMQDFHYFRLFEFTKCIQDLQIPCRWAPDSGAGFGEPVFNFYGQFVYAFGEIIHLAGIAKIDTLKILFALSLIVSAITMFFLSRKIWKNDLSALVSSIVYLYAPYRALDVWVRAALPEAFSFVFFPLIILEIERYLEKRQKKDLLIFSLLFALLVINHNLSIVLFGPFLIIWVIFRFLHTRDVKPFLELAVAGIFSGLLSAFYLLPVIFESKFVNINSTTTGIYDWRANFVKVYQLFISRYWGYGGSIDGKLSLSVGQMQWIIPSIAFAIVIIKHKINKETLTFLVLFLIGCFGLFLTHNKSTFIWNALPFMKYIQFPWRFLSVSIFAFAIATGAIIKNLKRFQWPVAILIILVTIAINFGFFRPDIWYKIADRDLENGSKWIESTFSSLPDYWPIFGPLPNKSAFTNTDDVSLVTKKSNSQTFTVKHFDRWIEFPVAYFSGWEIHYDGKIINATPSKNGLISANLKPGGSTAILIFKDTPVRTLGNWTTLISFGVWVFVFVRLKYAKNS